MPVKKYDPNTYVPPMERPKLKYMPDSYIRLSKGKKTVDRHNYEHDTKPTSEPKYKGETHEQYNKRVRGKGRKRAWQEMRMRRGDKPTTPRVVDDGYNLSVGVQVADGLAEGKTLKQIASELGINQSKITIWKRNHEQLRGLIERAMLERVEQGVERLYDLLDRVENGELDVKQAQFVADNLKWLAEKLHPKYQKEKESKLNVQADKVEFKIALAPNTVLDAPQAKLLAPHVEGEVITDGDTEN